MKRRFRRSIPLSRERQFYILGVSLSYDDQPETVRRRIDELCRDACPRHYEAFRRYVISEESAVGPSMEGYISGRVLEQAMKQYFLHFDIDTRVCN